MEDDIVISCIRTVVTKTCKTAGTLAWFTVKRIFDLLGLAFNILAICTVIRAVPTIRCLGHYVGKKQFAWAWKVCGFVQLLIFLMDIPLVVMLIVITIFPWRLYLLFQSKKAHQKWIDGNSWKEFGFEGWRFRSGIMSQFFRLLTDILLLPFGLVVLCSWRSVRTYNQMYDAKVKHTSLERKVLIMYNFVLVFVDLFVFVLFLLQCVTWRMPLMMGIVNKYFTERNLNLIDRDDAEWSIRRKIVFNFFRLILDIIMIPMVVLLLFSWRAPVLIKKFRSFKSALDQRATVGGSRWKVEKKLRGGIMTHFWRYIIDIVMLVPFIVVFCSWRCPILLLKCKKFLKSKMKRPDEYQFRYSIIFHFGQVIMDLLSIPPMFITILSWRLPFFCKLFPLDASKSVARKFKKVRLQFWKETAFFLLDIPVIIVFILCCIFPWRTLQLFARLTYKEVWGHHASSLAGVGANQWWATKYQNFVRIRIMVVFSRIVIDIFVGMFAVIVLVTGWRVPFLVHKLRKMEGRTSKKVWREILKQFVLVFVDMGSFILLVVIFGTLWRIKPMIRKIIKHSKYEDPNSKEAEDDDDDECNPTNPPNPTSVTNPPDPTIVTNPSDPTIVTNPSDSPNVPDPTNESGTNRSNQEIEMGIVEKASDLVEKVDDDVEVIEVGIKEDDVMLNKERDEPSCSDIFFGIRGWKIRKAICLNIVGLLMDIPSFIMLAINCVFIYQIPFIIQRFIECGDFYQEFFYIMIDETSNLLQDIVFFLIFIVLAVVRPVAVWVNLLEDTVHLKTKKSEEYLNQLHHIKKKRDTMLRHIESDLSTFVKYHAVYAASPDFVVMRLIDNVVVYTNLLKDTRDKMLERDLDDRLIFIVANLYFYESKTPFLYARRYKLEELYCQKPCPAARDQNLKVWTEEMEVSKSTLLDFYTQLDDYKVEKVPLWSEKIGFFARSRKQNQRVIINTVTSGYFGTIALFCLNSLLLYRVPSMICSMWRVRYCKYRVRDAALEQSKEYLLDFWAILKVVFVVLFVYRCPALISDLTHDLFSKRSLSAARKTVDKYPVNIFKDIGELLDLIFHWDTVIFIFSSILFVILIPLSVIINTFQASGMNIFCVFVLSLPLYFIVMSGPFIIVHAIADRVMNDVSLSNDTIPNVIAGYLTLIAVLVGAFVLVKTRAQAADKKQVKSIDYVRYNWFNAQVVILELLEFIQLLALVFSIRSLVVPYNEEIRTVAQYILLDVYDYKVRFGLSVVLFLVWLVVCTVPSLLEGVTKKVDKGHFSQNHFVWRSYLTFFGITLFVSLPELNMSLLACDYTQCLNSTLVANATVCPSLFEDPDIACWSGIHLVLAPISFIMMVWYVLTSMLFCLEYTDVSNKKVDLHFSPPYSSLVNLVKLMLVIGVSLFNLEKVAVLGFAASMMVLLIFISAIFSTVTGMDVCNSAVLLLWRIQIFLAVLFVTLGLLGFEIIDMTESYRTWSQNNLVLDGSVELLHVVIPCVVMGLVLLAFIVGLILSKYLASSSDQEQARTKFKNKVMEIIQTQTKESGFIPHWKKISTSFKRMLGAVRVAHKNDKEVKILESGYMTTDLSAPPPNYDDLDPDILNLPPPPSYEALLQDPIDIAVATEPVEADAAAATPDIDQYFLPTPHMYLSPIGPYQQFDATEIATEIKRRNPYPGGIFTTGWIMDETVPGAKEKQLTDSHCTGIDLLLLLEEHILYTSLSYEFIANLQSWRYKVVESNWIGLYDCVMELSDNINYRYNKPKDILKAEPSDMLLPHVDTSRLPDYVPMTDITELKLAMHCREIEKLMSYLPEPWLSIFKKLIPASDTDQPLLYRVTLGSEDESNLWNIKVEMFQEVEIVIKGVEEDGFKAAIGASIVLPNPIVISRIRKWNKRITFGKPFPYGKKGMLSKNITGCGMKERNGVYSLVAAGNTVKLYKVQASLTDLEWKFRD